jgi:hypothetical protein
MSESIKLPPYVGRLASSPEQPLISEYARLAVEQNTAELRAEVERLRDFALYYARCPCCQEVETCVGGCTFASDALNDAEAMEIARAALKEPTK